MAQTEVDGIDTLDPPPLGTVDLAKAKAEFGRRFFFKGTWTRKRDASRRRRRVRAGR